MPLEAEEAAELEAAEEEEAEPEAPVEVKRILLRPQASQSWNAQGCEAPTVGPTGHRCLYMWSVICVPLIVL